jgi:hypothetical protein
MPDFGASLTEDSSSIIYDCNVLMILPTGTREEINAEEIERERVKQLNVEEINREQVNRKQKRKLWDRELKKSGNQEMEKKLLRRK